MKKQWRALLDEQAQQPYYKTLQETLARCGQAGEVIYPPLQKRFMAFEYADIDQLKVVILGQDPYHGPDQANGLAFSVAKGCKIPPSLRNIYRELATDIAGFTVPDHGDLTPWAEQGVMLLNSVLSVEKAKAGAHAKLGWELFTDRVIREISERNPHCVFMLWGSYAQRKGEQVDQSKHLVLEAVHPSPLSAHRGYFGCRHFSQANRWLKSHGRSSIDWQIENVGSMSLF